MAGWNEEEYQGFVRDTRSALRPGTSYSETITFLESRQIPYFYSAAVRAVPGGSGEPIEVDGKLVRMMFELPPIHAAAELTIELATLSCRPQGVRLKVRDGNVVLNDQVLDDVVLWSDTAPPTVTAQLRPRSNRKPLNLRVWNVWRDAAGTMQAWIGDAGLVVEDEQDGSAILGCSDGIAEPSFDDLRVKLTLLQSG